jgi:site-specific recombinase XerD
VTTAGDFPEALENWWDDFARSLRRRNRSDATAGMYREAFSRFWRWATEVGIEPDPAAVTTADVNAFVDKLVAADLAPTTVAIVWRNLRPFFSWWAKEADAPNPFAGADVPTIKDDKPPPVIPLDDIRQVLATCAGKSFDDRRDTAIIRVLFDTGCRLGELVGLRVGDWDRRRDVLTFRGKSGTRVVSLSASTGEALARYLRARAQHRFADSDAMWLSLKGELHDSGVAQLLVRRCQQAGVPRLNPHRFRHTFSHEFRAQGGSERDLMYLAGWSSTTMPIATGGARRLNARPRGSSSALTGRPFVVSRAPLGTVAVTSDLRRLGRSRAPYVSFCIRKSRLIVSVRCARSVRSGDAMLG